MTLDVPTTSLERHEPYLVCVRADGKCRYCYMALELLRSKNIEYITREYENVKSMRDSLIGIGPVFSFPLIFQSGKRIGGYEHLVDHLEEPVLQEDSMRYALFPIKDPQIFDLYQKAVASFWSSNEISYRQDASDFESLSPQEQHFIKNVLAFFAQSDGIIVENLMANFQRQIKLAESQAFYSAQAFNESEHSLTYSLLIESIVRDESEKKRLLDAITQVPAVKQKAEWVMRWMNPHTERFATRLVAFACVEGILFSGSFAAIYWLKTRHPGKMPGLTMSNEFISRDEGLHTQHAIVLYSRLKNKLPQSKVHTIIRGAVDGEKEFMTNSIQCAMIGINAQSMGEYIEFVADRLCTDLGYDPIYRTANPFAFMNQISIQGKTNFFERRVSEYRKPACR